MGQGEGAGVATALRELAGRTVLLTGGAGFLGAALIEVFAAHNAAASAAEQVQVVVVDNGSAASVRLAEVAMQPGIRVIEADLCGDLGWLATLPPLHYVVHAAGLANPVAYQRMPLPAFDVAVTGTRRMLDLARAHGARLLFTSSSEIYGDPEPSAVPTPETYPGRVSTLGRRACYDEGKRAGETLCYLYWHELGVHTVMVRPFNVYGPGMRADDGRVLPAFLRSYLAGEPIVVHLPGTQTRSFCHVSDAVAGLLLALVFGRPAEAYNIGNDEQELSMIELAELFVEVTGGAAQVQYEGTPEHYPGIGPNRRCPDLAKARAELGYRPRTMLREGLRELIAGR